MRWKLGGGQTRGCGSNAHQEHRLKESLVNTPAEEFDIFEPETMPATVDVELELATRPAGRRAWESTRSLGARHRSQLPDAVAAAMADLVTRWCSSTR
jgi:hypothetical protein